LNCFAFLVKMTTVGGGDRVGESSRSFEQRAQNDKKKIYNDT
jgi:hypothetical protein